MLPWGDLEYFIHEQQAEVLRRAEQYRLMREAQRARQTPGGTFLNRMVHKGGLLLIRAAHRLQGLEKRVKHSERSHPHVPDSMAPIQCGAVKPAGRSSPASRRGR